MTYRKQAWNELRLSVKRLITGKPDTRFHMHDADFILAQDDVGLQIFLQHAEIQVMVATDEMRRRVLAEMERRGLKE